MTYLREKLEKEAEIQNKELELRRAELEAEKHKQEVVEQMQMSEQQTNVLKAFNMQMGSTTTRKPATICSSHHSVSTTANSSFDGFN